MFTIADIIIFQYNEQGIHFFIYIFLPGSEGDKIWASLILGGKILKGQEEIEINDKISAKWTELKTKRAPEE
jgi:hypothetical protein